MAQKIIVDIGESFVHNASSREQVEFLDTLFGELEDIGFEITDDDSLDIVDDEGEFDEDADGNGESFPYRAEAPYSPERLSKAKRIVAEHQRDTDEEIYVKVTKDAPASRVTPSVEAARRKKK